MKQTKFCSKCKKIKLTVDFSIDRSNNYGLRTSCKECWSIYTLSAKQQRSESYKKWRDTPEGRLSKIVSNQKYRSRKSNSTGGFCQDDVLQLLQNQKNKCVYCKQEISQHNSHLDHIHPLSLGGTNNISNIQILCAFCNISKSNKAPEDFAQKFGMII